MRPKNLSMKTTAYMTALAYYKMRTLYNRILTYPYKTFKWEQQYTTEY